MTLREFVTKFVERNTCCRLWVRKYINIKTSKGTKIKYDQELVHGEYLESQKDFRNCFMEWELLRGVVPQSNYLDCTFLKIADCGKLDGWVESVDLIISDDNIKDYYHPKKDIDPINENNDCVEV